MKPPKRNFHHHGLLQPFVHCELLAGNFGARGYSAAASLGKIWGESLQDMSLTESGI